MKYDLDFYTGYHQFYLFDKDSPGATDSDKFWTQQAVDDKLALEDGVIGVGTECYGPVKGELLVLQRQNDDFDANQFDHIVEGGLELKSGVLQILDCPDSTVQLELSLPVGTYRIRAYSANLASVVDEEGEDFYRIEIWPDDNKQRKVLKR